MFAQMQNIIGSQLSDNSLVIHSFASYFLKLFFSWNQKNVDNDLLLIFFIVLENYRYCRKQSTNAFSIFWRTISGSSPNALERISNILQDSLGCGIIPSSFKSSKEQHFPLLLLKIFNVFFSSFSLIYSISTNTNKRNYINR